MEPLKKETYTWIGVISFIPLFLFRMLSWLVIIVLLDLFSLLVFLAQMALNWIILFFIQHRVYFEPVKQSLLSIVFPVFKLPSDKTDSCMDFKIWVWILQVGNIFFVMTITALYILYDFGINIPWCLKSKLKIKAPENLLGGIFYATLTLFVASSLPAVLCCWMKTPRWVSLSSQVKVQCISRIFSLNFT